MPDEGKVRYGTQPSDQVHRRVQTRDRRLRHLVGKAHHGVLPRARARGRARPEGRRRRPARSAVPGARAGSWRGGRPPTTRGCRRGARAAAATTRWPSPSSRRSRTGCTASGRGPTGRRRAQPRSAASGAAAAGRVPTRRSGTGRLRGRWRRSLSGALRSGRRCGSSRDSRQFRVRNIETDHL